MEGLIGNLNKDKWQEVSVADKSAGYVEYHVNRAHKKVNDTTYSFMVETDEDTKANTVLVEHATGDPIGPAGVIELKIKGDKIIGMDLDGDVVEMKS